MPLSFPIIASPISGSRSGGDAHGRRRLPARPLHPPSADRPSAAARRSSCAPAPSRRDRPRRWSSSPDWARIPATGTPAIAGTSMAMPRAWPSLSVAAASLLTKVASTAASSGACVSTMALKPRGWQEDGPRAPRASSVASEPQARKLKRLPSTAIMPQPVRRSPGSMPRMRIGRSMIGVGDSAGTAYA